MSIIPNTTQTPNFYFDRIMNLLDEGELKTLLYAVRRTMGFHKQSDRISTSQFMNGNGRLGKDGEPVEYGTGLTKTTQIKCCQSLVDFGILVEVGPNVPGRNEGKEWALQLDADAIDFAALQARRDVRKSAAKKRTKKARAAAAEKYDTGLSNRPANNENGGLLDRPGGGLSNRPPLSRVGGSIQQTHRKKDRKPVRNTDHAREENAPDQSIDIIWGMLLETCGEQETAAAIWQLQQAFCESSGIPRPDIDTEYGRKELQRDWWPVILAMYKAADGDLEAAKAGVAAAVGDMLAWKATAVSGPWSIKKRFTGALVAQRQVQNAPPAAPKTSYQQLNQIPTSALLG